MTMASITRIDETAKAGTYWNSLKRISTCKGRVFVFPRKCPEMTETAPNSPMARAAQSTTPYRNAHLMCGNVILRKMVQPLAPISAAASSSSFPRASSTQFTRNEWKCDENRCKNNARYGKDYLDVPTLQ